MKIDATKIKPEQPPQADAASLQLNVSVEEYFISVREQANAAQEASLRLARARSELSAAGSDYESSIQRLIDSISKVPMSAATTEAPPFDASAATSTTAAAPAPKAFPPGPDGWRTLAIEAIDLPGGVSTTLRAHGIETLSHVEEWIAAGHVLAAIPGMTPAKRKKLVTRWNVFRDEHEEYRLSMIVLADSEPEPAAAVPPGATSTTTPGGIRQHDPDADTVSDPTLNTEHTALFGNVSEVLQSLHCLTKTPGKPDVASAKCPGHDDENPSLAIKLITRDQVALRCLASCTPGAIIAGVSRIVDERKRSAVPLVDAETLLDAWGFPALKGPPKNTQGPAQDKPKSAAATPAPAATKPVEDSPPPPAPSKKLEEVDGWDDV